MSRARTWLRYVGGSTSVTWQGLLVTYAASVLGYFAGGSSYVGPGVRLAVVTVATLAGFVPLVAVYWWLWRQPLQRPRPALMLSLFVLMALIRGMVNMVASVRLGIYDQYRPAFRILSAMPGLVLSLALVAIIVGSTRAHTARLAELSRVNAALSEAREQAALRVSDDKAAALARITAQLQEELDGLDPSRPAESAEQLQRLSADVVRPLSHELARSVPTWEPTTPPVALVRVRPRAVLAQVARGEPFAEIPTAAAATAIAAGMTFSLAPFPLATALLIGFGGGTVLVLVLLNALFAAIPTTCPGGVRALGFFVAAFAYGLVASVYMRFAATGSPSPDRLAWASFVLTVIFVVLFAIVKAYGEVQVESEGSLRAQNARLRWSVARARQVQWYQQRALSRLLHGPVQNTLDATAMRLDNAVRERQDVMPIIESAREELRAVLAGVAAERVDTVSVDHGIARMTMLWSDLCALDITVTDDAREALARDDICRMIVLELLTEGASNAIHHGAATALRIRVRRDGDVIDVTIADDGRLRPEGAPGLGSRMLDECAVTWTRRRTSDGHHLHATLPIVAS